MKLGARGVVAVVAEVGTNDGRVCEKGAIRDKDEEIVMLMSGACSWDMAASTTLLVVMLEVLTRSMDWRVSTMIMEETPATLITLAP